MKKALLPALLLAAACGGSEPPARPPLMPSGPPPAPLATATAPAPDAPPVADGDVTTGTVNGMLVIVRRMPGAAFAAGELVVRGGTRNWTAQNAGIEDLAFRAAASGGTKSLDKTAYSRRLASLGAQIWGDATNDFSQLSVNVPLRGWDDAFALLADVFENPALPASEIELARTQVLAQLHHEQEDPEGQLWTLERKQMFANHPYANRPIGTLESMAAIAAQEVAPYMDKLRETSRLFLVVAGDVDPAHVMDQARQTFGSLPRGSYSDTPLPPIAFDTPHIVTKERKLPTNFCESAFPAPRWNDPDWVTGQVAINALSSRLWQEVRTKRNLTYAVGASVNLGFAQPFGYMRVSAVDANAAMKVMLDEVKRLRDEPIADAELAGFKSVFLTDYLSAHETPLYQVASFVDAQAYGNDWRIARNVPDKVRAIGAADIQAYAKKYFVHMQAAVVGDPSKIDSALFTSM
jgi:zinc protease